MHGRRGDVRGDRDHAPPARDYRLERKVILAAEDIEISPAAGHDLGESLDLTARFLDADNIVDARQLLDDVGQHVACGAAGHVVEDLRNVDRLGDCLEMQVKAVLRGLVVVRCDQQAGIDAGILGHGREVNRLARGVRAGSSDNRKAAGGQLDHAADDVTVLVGVEGCRFAGGPDGDDGIGAVLDVKFDQPCERLLVHQAVAVHGCYHGDDAALKHALLRVVKSMHYATSPGPA